MRALNIQEIEKDSREAYTKEKKCEGQQNIQKYIKENLFDRNDSTSVTIGA